MRPAIMSLFALLALALGGCLRQTAFRCDDSTQCGAAGTCESTGYCSIPDSSCTGGARYTDTAGAQANQCVDGNPPIDAGADAPIGDGPTDASTDGPSPGCPGGYVTIAGGGTHMYRRIGPTDNWDNQHAVCQATSSGAYLAIPDDLAELQGIKTLGAAARIWIGLTDAATEGTFLTVKGAAATFLPWEMGAPDDGPPSQDCVELVSATDQINDERCNTQYVAVCECEP